MRPTAQIFGESGLNFARPVLNSASSLCPPRSSPSSWPRWQATPSHALTYQAEALSSAFVLLVGFFPILSTVGPLFLVYRHVRLLNSYPGLVLAYLIYTLPLAIWLLTNFFRQIPKELDEAAMVDGAIEVAGPAKDNRPRSRARHHHGLHHLVHPGMERLHLCPLVRGGPALLPAPVAIVNLGQSQFQVFYNQIDAAVVVVTLPVALVVLLAQRRIISGLTAGAIK